MPIEFRRLGRAVHPVIRDAEALAAVPDLDEALWIATAAPVATLRADAVFLARLDPDNDGRIRSDDVRAAIRWTFAHLADPKLVESKSTELLLASVPSGAPQGPRLLDAARVVQFRTNAAGSDKVTLDQVRQVRKEELARGLSEAGLVLPAAATGDPDVRSLIEHAIEVTGGEAHPSGQRAMSEPNLVKLLDEAKQWLAWHAKGADVQPYGPGTPAALAACVAVDAKLDQYFLLCDAIRLDPKLADLTFPDPKGVDLLDPVAATALLARAPLSRPRADGILDLDGVLNPAWADALGKLRRDMVVPSGGKPAFDRATWKAMREKLAAHAAWAATKPNTKVGARDVGVIRRHVEDPKLAAEARNLLAASRAAAAMLEAVADVEKLMLFKAHLLTFANSFVGQVDLFDLSKRTLFEQGDLVLDGRRFTLAVRVPDAARHEKFTSVGATFVMYVMIATKAGTWDYEVAVPLTAGERGSIVEGSWGVFVDIDGSERHAQVRKVIANPISIIEAILAPFYRIGAAVQGLLDKAVSAQEASLTTKVTALPDTAAVAVAAPAAPPAATPAPATSNIGAMLAGGGLALAAVGSSVAYITGAFWDATGQLANWLSTLPMFTLLPPGAQTTVQLLSVPLSLMLVILGFVSVPALAYVIPVSALAWLRLRRRDLSVILEGSGWAMNGRMYLNKDLARLFTQRPKLPSNASR